MTSSRFLTMISTALVLAGCATGINAKSADVSAAPRALVLQGQRCLPPGVAPDFFTWPVLGFRAVPVPKEDGSTVPTSWVLYKSGESEVVAVWTSTDLIAVDPSPTTDAPMWVDTGMVDGDSAVLRDQATAPCQWRKQGEIHAGLDTKVASAAAERG